MTALAAVTDIDLGILVLLGIGVLGGALGAWFFQKIRIPQVVGYIIAGLVIGRSGFKLLDVAQIEQLRSFTWFALGIVGFLVGGELKIDTFRRSGKQFFHILFWQGFLAFLLVLIPSAAIVYGLTGNLAVGVAAGLVFGAIATATDPASTTEVLWEFRAKGILTTTIIAVIALDDALAMALYGVATSVSEMLVGNSQTHLLSHMAAVSLELFGSVGFGLLAGAVMSLFLKFIHQKQDRTLAISIGMMLLIIGLTMAVGLDVILVTMAMGVVLINTAPHRAEKLFSLVKSFSVPIYVMFFVLVGARLSLDTMPGWLWLVVGVYFLGRAAGKVGGCWLGAKLSHAPLSVRNYGGLGLLPQGGITIGLSIMASQHLGDISVGENFSLGEAVVAVATTTTLFVQLIGPSLVKLSVRKGGEIGRNVTEEDIIDSLTVGQAAMRNIDPVRETESIGQVLVRFSRGDNLAYPVTDADGKITGLLTLSHLKDVFAARDCWDWMLVADIMVRDVDGMPASAPLADALKRMDETGWEQIPVIRDSQKEIPVGILDQRHAKKIVQQELIRVQTQS